MDSVPSASGLTMVSKKGMDASSLLSSTVGEIRFTKVKQRQLNKFNNLLNKKEGNITRANSPNLASQADRQALLPPGKEAA